VFLFTLSSLAFFPFPWENSFFPPPPLRGFGCEVFLDESFSPLSLKLYPHTPTPPLTFLPSGCGIFFQMTQAISALHALVRGPWSPLIPPVLTKATLPSAFYPFPGLATTLFFIIDLVPPFAATIPFCGNVKGLSFLFWRTDK